MIRFIYYNLLKRRFINEINYQRNNNGGNTWCYNNCSWVYISWLFALATPAGAATLMHIPVIISGIVLGTKIGALVGTIFGLSAIYYFTSIAPIWVLFPARPLIGVFAALSFNFFY